MQPKLPIFLYVHIFVQKHELPTISHTNHSWFITYQLLKGWTLQQTHSRLGSWIFHPSCCRFAVVLGVIVLLSDPMVDSISARRPGSLGWKRSWYEVFVLMCCVCGLFRYSSANLSCAAMLNVERRGFLLESLPYKLFLFSLFLIELSWA